MSKFNLQEKNNSNVNGNDFAVEVPFCCVQVVPGNLEVVEDRLEAEDLKMTFTPKLECCIKEEDLSCIADNVSCSIDGEVLRLVGCIEYAISTINGTPDPVRGDFSTEAPQQNSADVSCKSTVCVNEIICCGQDLECPDDLDLNEITVNFEDAKVKDCPKWADEPDKKIIKFTGKFRLPTLPTCPDENGNGNGDGNGNGNGNGNDNGDNGDEEVCGCQVTGDLNTGGNPDERVDLNLQVCTGCTPENSLVSYNNTLEDNDIQLDLSPDDEEPEGIDLVTCEEIAEIEGGLRATIEGQASVTVGEDSFAACDFTIVVTDTPPPTSDTIEEVEIICDDQSVHTVTEPIEGAQAINIQDICPLPPQQ
ncbi:hypothetical protein [Acetohalobium arabaticum]|uniref:Uncharacterized protein n=1 Tax=Acetohalobium arabaticum (strain ATCC 49924 / DSM 5501 / Z-7288) TaxID=574087 RepID=D9QST2_ACEAZ|nr:hypothetical protein [Acetohalobium arabaticum]ADL11620.1 hypothetical protein Acear_0069 [Acetohalobium arabaticum DSM 5501]